MAITMDHRAPAHQQSWGTKTNHVESSLASLTPYAYPVGRFLFSLLFVLSAFNHFSRDMILYATAQDVPAAELLVPLSGIIMLIGGAMVMLGYRARIGALLLALFLVPATLAMHNFWAFSDPGLAQNQQIHFMKNMGMLGACLMLFSFGSGPMSIDWWLDQKRTDRMN